MYGMYGKLVAQPEKRDEFLAIMTRAAERVGVLPGCRLYVLNIKADEPDAIWIYEVWDDKGAHDASLQDELVRALIKEAMPLMGGPPEGVELMVVGGHGLN